MKIIIFGSGTFAKQLHILSSSFSDLSVAAFSIDDQYVFSKTYCGHPLEKLSNIEKLYPPSEYLAVLGVGYSNMRKKQDFSQRIQDKGYKFANLIHPKSWVDKSTILGDGNIIFPNVVIEPGCKIGNNNTIWSSTNICHDVEIGSSNFIAAQSLIGGESKVGNMCFLGFNTTVINNIAIGDEVLIGAKSLIINDLESRAKFLGSPAKFICSIKDTGVCVS
jgi:sugar O-acyltransferase (sialic acid O-acetyltransferase NeuD family)